MTITTERQTKFMPAIRSAFGAFTVTALLAVTSLFVVAPPMVFVKDVGYVALNSQVVFDNIAEYLAGWRCDVPYDGPRFIACRLRWLLDIPTEMAGSPLVWTRFENLAIALVTAASAAFIMTYWWTPPVEAAVVKRGRRVLFDEYARRAIQNCIGALGDVQQFGLWLLQNVQLSRAQEGRNILLTGTQGSGKTGLLRAYIRQLCARGDRLFILDTKGDMLAGLPVDDFILAAAHDARSWVINLGREIVNRTIAMEFAAKCVSASKNDPMWSQAVRSILADIAMVLRKRHQDLWGWTELRDLGLSSPEVLRGALAEIQAASAGLITHGDNPDDNRTVMSILVTLWVAVLTTIHPLAEAFAAVAPERRFTVKDWMTKDSGLPRVLIFQKSSDFPELSELLGSFLAERVAAAALSPLRRGGNGPRLAMILDEFSEVPIERLPRLLSLGREMEVITIGSLQDLDQLKTLFGDASSIVESRFGIRLVLRLEPGNTTERITTKWLGNRRISRRRDATVDELKAGITKPRETVEELTIPAETLTDELGVRETSDGKVIRLLVSGFPIIGIVDVPLTTWPDRREAHVPAPWMSPD
jgi:Type IV secretion-system coupling protein DNA-binding domain